MSPNKILELYECVKKFDQLFIFPENGISEIYHYTSAEGFDKILFEYKSGNGYRPRLQFSRYDVLNDKSEGNDILEVYEKVLDELLSDGQISDEYYRMVKQIKKEDNLYNFAVRIGNTGAMGTNRLVPDFTIDTKQGQVYLCCFSKNRDSLPMWNYYVKDGTYQGYNIGFSVPILQDGVRTGQEKGYIFQIYNVIYEEERKKEILKELLLDLYKFYTLAESDQDKKRIKDAIISSVNRYRFAFKKECFQHEQEIRIVLVTAMEEIEGAIEQKKFPIYYRNVGEYMIPYIFYDELDVYAITEVNGGPMENEELKKSKKEIMEERFRNAGYESVKIGYSEIPVRY